MQDQLDKLKEIAAVALESIQALERVTAAHTTQIDKILTGLDRTDVSIRAMADEMVNTQREWQAYLRRIPRQ